MFYIFTSVCVCVCVCVWHEAGTGVHFRVVIFLLRVVVARVRFHSYSIAANSRNRGYHTLFNFAQEVVSHCSLLTLFFRLYHRRSGVSTKRRALANRTRRSGRKNVQFFPHVALSSLLRVSDGQFRPPAKVSVLAFFSPLRHIIVL